MRLLLTSSGIQNQSIASALLELVGVESGQVRLTFVPTAMNVEDGDKGWLIDDLLHFKDQGYESIDIVDISAVPKDTWLPRLEAANVICFGGGNEQYLARVMSQVGFADVARTLFTNRVYMGISAGSMVAGKFLSQELLQLVYPDDLQPETLENPLGLVDLNFIPHLNSPYFPQVRKDVLATLPEVATPTYVLDDQSALKIVGDIVEVVTEGEYLKI